MRIPGETDEAERPLSVLRPAAVSAAFHSRSCPGVARGGVIFPPGDGEEGPAGSGPFLRADGALRRPSSFGPLRDLLPSPRKGTLGGRPELGVRLRGGPPRRDPVRIPAEVWIDRFVGKRGRGGAKIALLY